MYTYPNQYYSYPSYSGWGSQPAPFESASLQSASTTALQDIIRGQERVTSGLFSLLSEERTSSERSTRGNKQQLTNLVTLSQNFLGFLPDVEQKFSALESSIRVNCANADNADLQDRLDDMVQTITNLRRIAESFACSAGLRLVPGPAPNHWGWVPASTPQLQQDYTSFGSTFPYAPHIFPTTIPNSTQSSAFAHSNPARSVHWPTNLDAPPPSSSVPWLNQYPTSPLSDNPPSRISLGGVCGFSGMSSSTIPPPSPIPPTLSGRYSPPMTGQYGPSSPVPTSQKPSGRPPPFDTVNNSPGGYVMGSLTPSQTESVVGSLHRTRLSPISESRTPSPPFPPLPAFDCTPLGGPSPSTSTIETLSTPSGTIAPPANAAQASLLASSRVRSAPNDPTRQVFLDMMYPSVPSSTVPSIISTSPGVEIPPSRSVETVHWSSLFPSAPVVVRPPVTTVSSVDETVSTRSIACYTDSHLSSPSEPMTPLSRASGEVIEAMTPQSCVSGEIIEEVPPPVPTKLTTDIVANVKASDVPSVTATSDGAQAQAVASTSSAPAKSSLPQNQLVIQLLSFFFESVQRIFKVPASVDLTYKGFEVSFSTDCVPWNSGSVVGLLTDDADGEQDRTFEMMPAPSNAALHRYIRDLARVRMDLAAMQAGEGESKEQAIVQLELRVKAEQETTQNWVRRVCKAAGALSIVDPAFSPRK